MAAFGSNTVCSSTAGPTELHACQPAACSQQRSQCQQRSASQCPAAPSSSHCATLPACGRRAVAMEVTAQLGMLHARRAALSGAQNKKARQTVNQKIRALEQQQQQQQQTTSDEGTVCEGAGTLPALEPEPGAKGTTSWAVPGNYLPSSARGCHVAHGGRLGQDHAADSDAGGSAWIVSSAPFDEADFGLEVGDEVPDLSIDPDDACVLSCAAVAVAVAGLICCGRPAAAVLRSVYLDCATACSL
jgi:hypothetical protein